MKDFSADWLRSLSKEALAQLIRQLPDEMVEFLMYDWYGVYARPAQQVPGTPLSPEVRTEWRQWIVMAGRGFGKTRTGAEWVRWRVEQGARAIALIGRTKADVRDVMVEGSSGLLSIFPPDKQPRYQPAVRRITFATGAVATTYSADEPDQLRGPQTDTIWWDEMAAAREGKEMWDNANLGLRLSSASLRPQALFTTTPRRVPLLRHLLRQSSTVITGGSTYENLANLDQSFREAILAEYEGTRLGQQELYAQLLEDNPDALWQYSIIDAGRMPRPEAFRRIVVGVDPQAASVEDSAETGIIVAGRGYDDHLYVLADYTVKGTPAIWGQAVAKAYHQWRANLVVGEVNNGGDMVGFVIAQADARIAYKAVHASRGKQVRAEPISALYQKGWAHHISLFPHLEDQMTQWIPGDASPDRMDALVWAATELMLGGPRSTQPAFTTRARDTVGLRIPA